LRLGCLGVRSEEGAKGNVIGAGLGGLQRKIDGIVASDADDGIVAETRAGGFIIGVRLTDMNAVAAGIGGEIGPVVNEEGNIPVLASRPQNVDGTADGVVVGGFKAKLDAIDIARVQRFRQDIGERRRLKARRGNQVQPAGVWDQPLP